MQFDFAMKISNLEKHYEQIIVAKEQQL